MSTHPVTFQTDYVESRSRLTTFFRLLLAIPHMIVLILYAFAAYVVVIIAWFALLFTGRWPRGMYDFVAGFLRYSTAVTGYLYLLTDAYPPFGPNVDDYPVRLDVAPPKAGYSRLKVLFRIILAIPPMLIAYAMGVVAQVGAFLAWFAIVALGRQPKGLQDMTVLGVSYQQRAYGYLFLLTEDWPPFTDDATRRVESGPQFGSLPPTPPAAGTSVPPPAPSETAPPHGDPLASAPAEEPPAPPPAQAPRSGPEAPPHGDPLGGEATPPDAPPRGDPLGGDAAPPAAPPRSDPVGGDAAPPKPDTAPPERRDDEEPPRGPFGPSSTP
jgi:uncharacterized protein DUF4389